MICYKIYAAKAAERGFKALGCLESVVLSHFSSDEI